MDEATDRLNAGNPASRREIALASKRLKDIADEAKLARSEAYAEYDEYRTKTVPDLMNNAEINSITIKGIGRLGLTNDAYASIIPGKKEEAYQWVTETEGDNSLIQETINSSTLKAWLKEIIKQGEFEIPEDLFNFTPFQRATLTKS